MYEHPAFKTTVHAFLNNNLYENKWQHQLREEYRLQAWKTLARERCQHFAGIENGIQRSLTTSLIKELTAKADELQRLLDANLISTVDPATDPRPKLKVLRLLLSAGLQTPERDHRHRKLPGSIQCACKTSLPTIYHLSWECPLSQSIRDQMMHALPVPLHTLPTCFKIATIIPLSMQISKDQIHIIQSTLVQIWQKHIQEWNGQDEDVQPHTVLHVPLNPPAPQVDSGSDANLQAEHPAPKRGHILKLIPSGVVFCCRCGKQTKNLKHQRLKILNKPCAYPDLPETQWLTEPGFNSSIHRTLALEKQLNEQYNTPKHSLIWNRQVGKDRERPNFGKLWCSACGREWPWMYRHNQLPRSTCNTPTNPPVPPDWVQLLSHYTPNNPSLPNLTAASSSVHARPRFRIRGKQSPNLFNTQVDNLDSHDDISGGPSSSSGLHHRRGIG